MADRICTTPGCERRMIYTTRGVCKRCYGRQRADEKPRKRAAPWTPDVVRFEARIGRGENDCWQWVGASSESRPGGGYYGCFSGVGRIKHYAHRWSYEYHRAPIPDGLEIDHLCRNTLCVNPWHLEPVTGLVNHQRAAAARTKSAPYADAEVLHLGGFCKRGHEFTPENTKVINKGNGRRTCRTCTNARRRARSKANPKPPRRSEFCKNGHPLSGDNLVEKSGIRVCRTCRSIAAQISNRKRWGAQEAS